MTAPQTIFITGSSSGFGRLIAETLIAQGHTVFATMRNSAERNLPAATALRTHADAHLGRVHILECDVTSNESVTRAVADTLALTDRLDVVVNNAGVGGAFANLTETVSLDQFEHSFDVNVFGVQRVMRAVLPTLRAQGHGLIVNVSSAMGRIVLPFAGAYTATKYALEGLSETYRYELAPLGVEVSLVQPGGLDTAFWHKLEASSETDRVAGYGELAAMPLQMYGGMADSLASAESADAQQVADVVAEMVAMPAGSRPARTVVDPVAGGAGPSAVNATSTEVQTQLFEALGLSQLLTVAVPTT